ncbi:uncharacterized protein BJX67DRAFT_212365 [Aspergillus lucknowensis]|uniref:Uncharacterized protein n=1 Tax=Aspergillus lucknowensis TaxID=176173 RepID=A0ABR4M2E6_9EURO
MNSRFYSERPTAFSEISPRYRRLLFYVICLVAVQATRPRVTTVTDCSTIFYSETLIRLFLTSKVRKIKSKCVLSTSTMTATPAPFASQGARLQNDLQVYITRSGNIPMMPGGADEVTLSHFKSKGISHRIHESLLSCALSANVQ